VIVAYELLITLILATEVCEISFLRMTWYTNYVVSELLDVSVPLASYLVLFTVMSVL
jgi:hypothetical protein